MRKLFRIAVLTAIVINLVHSLIRGPGISRLDWYLAYAGWAVTGFYLGGTYAMHAVKKAIETKLQEIRDYENGVQRER
jgi:hypothetical protein